MIDHDEIEKVSWQYKDNYGVKGIENRCLNTSIAILSYSQLYIEVSGEIIVIPKIL